MSRKKKVLEDSVECNIVRMLSWMVRARLLIDFNHYRVMKDLEQFKKTWTHHGVLCSVQGDELVFSDQLV